MECHKESHNIAQQQAVALWDWEFCEHNGVFRLGRSYKTKNAFSLSFYYVIVKCVLLGTHRVIACGWQCYDQVLNVGKYGVVSCHVGPMCSLPPDGQVVAPL